MKKHLYFAAMALAVMSSCSNDDVVDNPGTTPIDDEQAVAIELGLSAPQAMVTTKGLGTVGSTDPAKNLWNGEKLYVVMLDAEGNEATDDEGTIFDNTALSFKAPTQTGAPEDDDAIFILDNNDPSGQTVKAKYYPSTGKYSFYGYHIDNIEGTTPTFTADTKTVSGIAISGTEDLMAAQTKAVDNTNYADIWDGLGEDQGLVAERAFSAWTARRGIQPILQFDHLLTRLQFNVIAGNQDAAENYYEGGWQQNQSGTEDASHQNESTAVKINAIRVINVKTDNITIDLEGKQASSTGEATNSLTLMGTEDANTDGDLDALTPTSPKAYDATAGNYDDENYPQKTPVGESIMLLPGDATITIEIDLSQLVVDTESLDGTPLTYAEKSETLTATLNAKDIKQSGTDTAANKEQFLAGESYNINITVYSFQRIEVNAELTPWTDGGDINIAPGDQF